MLDFIVNPSAGGKKGKKIASAVKKIEKYLKEHNVEYAIHYTTERGHATTLTSSLIDQGATDIVVMGGDGTLHEVINGFHSFERVNMGIIPCGTGNDFASAMGLSLDPLTALHTVLTHKAQYTDFMQLPGVRGLNAVGTGIDVEVLKTYSKLKRKTKFGYTWSLIKTLFNFDYTDFEYSIDQSEPVELRSFIACVGNGNVFGGGIPICPNAKPNDKELDFIAVKEMSTFKIIGAFIKLKKGKILSLRQTIYHKGQHVKVTSKKPFTVNVDGELYEGLPFDVQIVSNTLKIYK